MKSVFLISSFFLFLGFSLISCTSDSTAEQEPLSSQVESAVPLSPDSSLAGVYAPWDGHWKGEFVIYTHPDGQLSTPVQPQITDLRELISHGVVEQNRLSVEQFYESESPFYQRVKIIDTYENAEGEEISVTSTGYNAVEGKELICVVNKPDEQVIHKGAFPQDSVLIWSRSWQAPLKVEYFYEKVEGDTYSIIGWGYYGKDDPQKAPKMWFSAAYERQP